MHQLRSYHDREPNTNMRNQKRKQCLATTKKLKREETIVLSLVSSFPGTRKFQPAELVKASRFETHTPRYQPQGCYCVIMNMK